MHIKGFMLIGLSLTTPDILADATVPKAPVVMTYTKAFIGDNYGEYHSEVLHQALAVTRAENIKETLIAHPFPLTQSRQIRLLQTGIADVMWSVTSDKLESTLLPVRFPLLQGFGGQRVLVFAPTSQSLFSPTDSLNKLKQLSSVQGGDWPDYHILSVHQFNVSQAP